MKPSLFYNSKKATLAAAAPIAAPLTVVIVWLLIQAGISDEAAADIAQGLIVLLGILFPGLAMLGYAGSDYAEKKVYTAAQRGLMVKNRIVNVGTTSAIANALAMLVLAFLAQALPDIPAEVVEAIDQVLRWMFGFLPAWFGITQFAAEYAHK